MYERTQTYPQIVQTQGRSEARNLRQDGRSPETEADAPRETRQTVDATVC